jgi:hypothetical protein
MSPELRTTGRNRRRVLAGALAAALALAAGACAEEAEAPDVADLAAGELDGWARVGRYDHADVHPFDQVAAAPGSDGAVWFTRASGSDGLAVWSQAGGQDAVETPVAAPDGVAIPVAVAGDEAGWSAVAVTRDTPEAPNRGVVAWRSSSAPADDRAGPPAEPLSALGGVPGSVTVARSDGVTVVSGVVDGAVATWLSDGDGWSAGLPELGVDEVVSARVAGTSTGFVLAAVGRDGRGRLWSSNDGRGWSSLDVSGAGLDDGLAAVGVLAEVDDGDVVAAWLVGDAAAEDVARDAEQVLVHRVEGNTVRSAGAIEAEPGDGIDRIDVNGAARRGDFVVVAGAAIAPDGSARPGLWAGAGDAWARSSQSDLIDQPDVEFRTIAASGDGGLDGVLAARGHIDVELWRSQGLRP